MKIYIVIPVFNRWDFTRELLFCLKKQSYKNFTTIIVDHGSTDGTSEYIAQYFPEVILLKGDESMWWTRATNLGIEEAMILSNSDNDFILTLNNDLEVNSEYLKNLIILSQEIHHSIIGSSCYDIFNKEKLCFAGIKWNKYTAKYGYTEGILSAIGYDFQKVKFVNTDLLPGRGTLFPIKVFKKIGLFNQTDFPHYAADEDFSLICAKNGYRLIVSLEAKVFSYISESGLKSKNNPKSLKMFLKSFWVINSPNNLRIRLKWATRNTPIPTLYFCLDITRIIISFLRNLLIKSK